MVRPRDQNAPGKVGEVSLLAALYGKAAQRSTRDWWRDYISDLACSRLGVDPEELSKIAENREVFRVLCACHRHVLICLDADDALGLGMFPLPCIRHPITFVGKHSKNMFWSHVRQIEFPRLIFRHCKLREPIKLSLYPDRTKAGM